MFLHQNYGLIISPDAMKQTTKFDLRPTTDREQ